MKRVYFLFALVLFFSFSFTANSQVSQGGLPESFPKTGLLKQVTFSTMQPVNVAMLQAEDVMLDTMKSFPWRFGDNLIVDLSPQNSGVWDTLSNGTKIWRLGIRSAGALTINLTFDQYKLPPGAKLFVYNSTKTDVIGAFSDYNNQADSTFATTLVRGDSIIIEYNEPEIVAFPAMLHLWRVTHGYRNAFEYAKAFGSSGSCQINVACPTGTGWENEIRSVCMLVTGGSGFCTGSLINNTANDGTPYILTANHCYSAPGSWVFWFNWQSATCTNPGSSPSYNSISGAVLKARTTTSDFCLVQMNSTPPSNYNVYYEGWNRTTTPPPSGMGIHHPNGDIKKISPAGQFVNYGSYDAGNGAADCWNVPWTGTACTEPGSSGSPIYDNNHLLVGQLYGGPSACGATSANMNDYYGRFCTSWTGDGTSATRLSDWLDPLATSPMTLPGHDPNGPQAPVASFSATPTSSCTGVIQFTDASTGSPTSWAWNFGDGGTSSSQSPSHTYATNGTFTVTLVATNSVTSDTATMTNYITINLPSSPTATGASSCGAGSVTLSASGNGTLEWYNAATGGSVVNTGTSYPTPSLSTTTTYYVQDSVPGPSQYVGMLNDTTTGANYTQAVSQYEVFTSYSPFTLVSVEVVAATAGNRTITLQNSSGTVLQTTTVNVPTGRSRITLNFNVPVGTNLRLAGPTTPNLYRSNSGVAYPYTIANVVSITTSSASTNPTTYYYYFYKWEIKQGSCISARTPVTATINTPLAGNVSIAAIPTGAICTGTSVTFTATPVNGGTTPSYQWKKNGTDINNATNQSYNSNTLANNDIITCVMTSALSCVTNSPATSSAITMVVSSALPAGVTIAANPGSTICSGTSVTFTATPTNGGTSPTYQWKKNGTNISGATNSTWASGTLVNSDAITCVMTSNSACVTGSPATSTAVTMTVNSPAAVTVGIAVNPTGSICTGTSVTFTATPTNGGTTPSYQWKKNGVAISGATNSTYTSNTLVNNDAITCTVTSNATCITGSPATSSAITMVVSSALPASIVIAANPGSSICTGSSVTFTATPTNGGTTPSYQWKKNGTNISGATNSTYSSGTLANNDAITCVMTSGLGCVTGSPATSSAITMTVNTPSPASVTISVAPGNTICAGSGVTFTAQPVNGGTTPSYQWKKNGVIIPGATNISYSSSTLADADAITCVMTSALGCVTGSPATSGAITMTVNPAVTAGVSITANPLGGVCTGTSITFTATPANGGTSPLYQWQINGANIGTNAATFVSSSLNNGDVVTCNMTSNAACAVSNPATSNAITTVISSALTAGVNIVASPGTTTCPGSNITFTATAVNGGINPVYVWKVNGTAVGTNSSTYASATLNTGDIVTCQMTSSSSCATGNPATSNALTINITSSMSVIVLISATPGINICAGTNVTFTATPYNGGIPSYQWYVNGALVGTNSSTYSTSNLADNDVVNCVMTSSESCATNNPASSNSLTVQLNAAVPSSVTIAANPAGSICSGAAVIFTATPVNGGTSPVYQWQLNGANVGSNSPVYSSSTLSNGDIVNCLMISSLTCVTGSPATSNNYTAVVNSTPVTPIITLSGDTLISSAAVGNQWYYHNSLGSFPITGATGQTYVPLVTGDYFSIATNLTGCSSDTSNMIYVLVLGINEIVSTSVHIYPNPVTNTLYVDFSNGLAGNTEIEIVNYLGQMLNSESFENIGKESIKQFDMSMLPKGIYFLRIKNEHLIRTEKIVLD